MPDDNLALQSTPYSKTLEFAGVFEVGEHKTPPLSVEVAYSGTNSHPPTGIIRGTSNDFHALERFFLTKRATLCSLRSTSKDRASIVCTDVHIKRLSERQFPKDERSTIHQVLGHFTIKCTELRTILIPSSDTKRRQTVFFLTGPSKLWLSQALRTISYTGEISVNHVNTTLSVDAVPDAISVAPHFVYTEYGPKGGDPRQSAQAELFSLTISDAFQVERDESAFSVDATAVTDTLCLLMSFLSKTYITWFASTYSDGAVVLETYREARTTDSEAPDWEEVVLNSDDIRPFLNQGFAAYRESIEAGFDLRLPMLHYIWSQSSKFAEDHFTVLFFALEKLLSSLDDRDPEDDLLTDKELSKLWKVMRPALEEMKKTDDQVGLILQKRRELQRAPLKHRLMRHLRALDIDLSDIGDEAGLGKMIYVRNLLAHEKGEVPIKEIVFETRRLETIVERTLLRLLAWNGKTQTPTYYNRPIRDEES